MAIYEENNRWNSRKIYIMALICQCIGISNVNSTPNNAMIQGTLGYTILFAVFCIFLGIPVLYMESIVGQFTTRDCIDVWKIRPCLSFIGYVLVMWQACFIIYNHTVTSFFLHYFLISFENPVPYYTCGSWSTKYCKSLANNYTVNQDCVKYQHLLPYCEDLYETFPEYQYWRLNLLKPNSEAGYHITWRVCLASALISFVTFLSCFKRHKSLKWVVSIFVIYPVIALSVLLMGSMRQKGLVAKYDESLDLDFQEFERKFRLSSVIIQVVHNLNIGSGLMFTLASSASFRSPCFSDVVISVVFSTTFTVLYILTVAMMTCPYAYEYGIQPVTLIKTPMSFSFEKIPRLLHQYQNKTLFLVTVFSCNFVLGLCTSVTYHFNFVEIILKRSPKLAKYPGLTTFSVVIIIFLITIPLLSHYGINFIAFGFRRYFTALTTFIAILECFVFIIWYGIHKFSEDVHFMLGVKQKSYIKIVWVLSLIFMIYSFGCELYYQIVNPAAFIFVTYGLLSFVGIILLLFVVGLLVAGCRKKFRRFVSLDATWGANDEILQRSRAMFSAQAMTKEYIYRQYHLQAGILKRQQTSNKRVCYLQNL